LGHPLGGVGGLGGAGIAGITGAAGCEMTTPGVAGAITTGERSAALPPLLTVTGYERDCDVCVTVTG
jgi:hypothetical protein